ncbi:hypothetical protein ACFJIV_08455 [Mucilaginibacter sp. UC70_90]
MKKIYLYTLAGAFTFLGAGCNKLKDFGDVKQQSCSNSNAYPFSLVIKR